MKLTNEIIFEKFREEMQHRVVKYPLNSRPVKEALRFAKKHKDPAFYRVAADKIHAQRQFQREMFGPGKLERFIDFLSLGSLRELAVMLLLVVAGVLGLDFTRRAFASNDESDIYAHLDVDELATRLGIVLEEKGSRSKRTTTSEKPIESRALEKTEATSGNPNVSRLSDSDITRIAEAVIERLKAREISMTALKNDPAESLIKKPETTAGAAAPGTATADSLATLTDDDLTH